METLCFCLPAELIIVHTHLQRDVEGDWQGEGWLETDSIYGALLIILFAPRVSLCIEVNIFSFTSEEQASCLLWNTHTHHTSLAQWEGSSSAAPFNILMS